jgi:hypothetical protein
MEHHLCPLLHDQARFVRGATQRDRGTACALHVCVKLHRRQAVGWREVVPGYAPAQVCQCSVQACRDASDLA